MIHGTRVVGGLVLLVLAVLLCSSPAMAATSYDSMMGTSLQGNGVYASCDYLYQNYYEILPAYAHTDDDFNLFALWSPPGCDFDLYLFDASPQLIAYSASATLFTDDGNQLDYIGYAGNSLPAGAYYAVPLAYYGSGTYLYAHLWKDYWYFY